MGVVADDFDGSDDLFRPNFSDERPALYANRGDGAFDDAAVRYGLDFNTGFVGWECALLDAYNDGWRDVLLVNGPRFPRYGGPEGQ